MSAALSAAIYMGKAKRALDGARLLLEAGETEGACSRAYYAMFDAAHAALIAGGVETTGAEIKTHNGLLTLFSKTYRRTALAGLGKALNQVQELRLVADYSGELPATDKAQWAVEQAEAFVAAVIAALT